ncbi:MAG TPA: glycosyltransferase [Candidatus Limnocylindria bacterium]
MSDNLPDAVRDLLDRRAAAREARDFATADQLRDELGALGWEAIDGPRGSTARPLLASAGAATYADDAQLASLLDEPASIAASVLLVVDDHPADADRLLSALQRHLQSPEHEVVLVANAPATEPVTDATLKVTALRVAERLGWADAVNLGLRRSRGAVVVLLDTSVEPEGDILGPLVAAFDDPRVGVAGPWGVTSGDAREFVEAPPGEVDAIEGYCLAVRREALQQVGGFDHRFRFYRNADLDLSFGIRANGWTAMATEPLPLRRHEHRGWTAHEPAERDRLSKRNFYRFLKHWGDRRDLLLHPGARDTRGRPTGRTPA